MARTTTTIEADITTVRTAINAVLVGGQSYEIDSGGSKRKVTMADLPELRKLLNELLIELDNANGNYSGLTIGANW